MPKALWKLLAKFVLQHLLDLIYGLCGGGVLPEGFGVGLSVFLHKAVGVMPEAVFLHPLELRPLILKSKNNEMVAGGLQELSIGLCALLYEIMPVLSQDVSHRDDS